jgi:hypothetical protein
MWCYLKFILERPKAIARLCWILQKIRIIIFKRYIYLSTPRKEIAFTARPKIQSQSQIFRYGGSIFCLPHRPNFSDIFNLYLHSHFYSAPSIFTVFRNLVWEIWFEKYGSRYLVREKWLTRKKVVLYHKSARNLVRE